MRTKLEINKVEFQRIVSELEAKTTFINPSALWKAVEETEWAKAQQPRPLTAAVAYARAKEFGISYQVKPGKKGGGGNPNLGKVPRVPRSIKFKKFKKSFELMRKEVPERFLPIVDKLERGSAMAGVKLKCLECSNWQPREIRDCVCEGCSLYPIRPFQGKSNE